MKDYEEHPENTLGKLLSESFADFELPANPALKEELFRKIPSRRSPSRFYILPVILVIVGSTFLLTRGPHREPGSPTFSKASGIVAKGKVRTASPVVDQGGERIASADPTAEDHRIPTRPVRIGQMQTQIRQHRGTLHTLGEVETALFANENKQIYVQREGLPGTLIDSLSPGIIPLLKPVPFREIPGPALPCRVQSTFPTEEQHDIPCSDVKRTARAFAPKWSLSVTPMQSFQVMKLWSSPQLSLQNIRFSPVLSLQSKAMKVSGGLEAFGVGLLASYSYIGNRVHFETATNEYIVVPSDNQSYAVIRKGMPLVREESLNLLSLGIRKNITLGRGRLSNYRGAIGLDYSRILAKKRSITMAGIGIYRQWSFGTNASLFVGPYAQVGLTQRVVIPGIWKYRPYQLGISVGIRKN